ncbi:hypothetical protein SAMN05421505_11449 [Sinosporangium album]|uniref:AAA+ ATPase domain-containing protein n=1 Tax=Sinosporangium album TaxID=504805 RepID=A0A1G8BHM7_9ACTN|nr:hypothetical protein [Sinosporangium album]SDH32736.1 hypothetical protein SAMN05421505_11449 [Sinosporangium album]
MRPHEVPADPPGRNPFPSSAIAHLVAGPASPPPTVPTPALIEVTAFVNEYLSAIDPSRTGTTGLGRVLAVIGEFGTGKTHIALEVLHSVKRRRSESTTIIEFDEPGRSMLRLYLDRFIKKISPEQIKQLAEDYHHFILMDDLQRGAITRRLTTQPKFRERSADEIINRLGMSRNVYLDKLRAALSEFAVRQEFAIALQLVLEDEYQPAVHAWLSGEPPDDILREHGITTAIDDEFAAFEAIGVLAFLHGRTGRKLIVLIDEFERLLPLFKDPEIAPAFERLLNAFVNAGCLLILFGLPDAQPMLSANARERVRILPPSLFTADHVRAYLQLQLGQWPHPLFDEEAADEIVRISDGIPRQAIQLCHYAYGEAMGGEPPARVTGRLVGEVARRIFREAEPIDISAAVRRIINSEGWTNHEQWRVPGKVVVDFWIPVGRKGACAVWITDTVLDEAEVARLETASNAVLSEANPIRRVLVINGRIPTELVSKVNKLFDRAPIQYNSLHFDDEFRSWLHASTDRIARSDGADAFDLIDKRTERLGNEIRDIRRVTESLLEWIHLSAPARALPARPASRLPISIGQHFDRALRALASLDDLDRVLRQLFAVERRRRPRGPRSLMRGVPLRQELATPAALPAVGATVLLYKLVAQFQVSVQEWLDGIGAEAGLRDVDPQELDRLREICDVYEATADLLPMRSLDHLVEWTSPFSDVSDTGLARKRDLRQAFDGLGPRVYRSVLATVEARN